MIIFNRKTEVRIADRLFVTDDYEIDFDVSFDDKAEPDTATVDIYNLSDKTRGLIVDKERIVLNAGYGKDIGTIFAGTVQNFYHRQEGADIRTHVEIADGADEYRQAFVSASFEAGTPASVVIAKLLSGFGLSAGTVRLANDVQYANGKAVHGGLQAELKRIVSDCGSKIYIRGGLVHILPIAEGLEQIYVLNSDSGLLSVTEYKDESFTGYLIEMALNNKITVDSKVRISSKFVNGLYRVVKGRHTSEYITEAVVVSAD